MAVTATPIFPQTPWALVTSAAAKTACTTRGPTVTASLPRANIFEIAPVSTNGRRVDKIQVSACSTSMTAPTAANIVGIWMWDGTSAYLIDEILVAAVTPNTTTTKAFTTTLSYPSGLILPAAFKLYASLTVTTTASTTALQIACFGGDY